MNYLQLVQAVFDDAGIQGTAPVTVVTATSGINKRLKNWVNEAWRKIQVSRKTWKWMRASASVQTTASQRAYTPSDAGPVGFGLDRWARWAVDTFRCYLTSVGVSDEQFLIFMEYDRFRDTYLMSSAQNVVGRPFHFSIKPSNGAILLGPAPDAIYTVYGDYYKSYQSLTADNDIPELPADFHMAIVFRSLMRYGTFDAAPEVYDDAKNDFDAEMSRLEVDQLEAVSAHDTTMVE